MKNLYLYSGKYNFLFFFKLLEVKAHKQFYSAYLNQWVMHVYLIIQIKYVK